jgi:hypothetical protein
MIYLLQKEEIATVSEFKTKEWDARFLGLEYVALKRIDALLERHIAWLSPEQYSRILMTYEGRARKSG